MSASSGIAVSPDLANAFSSAQDASDVRFLKIAIRNESLVPDGTAAHGGGTFEDDLPRLQDMLEENKAAYVLAKLDKSAEWLAISYVPDHAPVREKMLYASTWNSLTKSLGSSAFTDSIFATSRSDLTPEGYKAHRAHMAAPKPMTAAEREAAEVKAAERAASGASYEGSRARVNHVGQGVGFAWEAEASDAVVALGGGDGAKAVILTVHPTEETLQLHSESECDADRLGSSLPSSDPCYVFYAWPHDLTSPPRRDIVFIYSCPTGSPVKRRMVYSSAFHSVFNAAKQMFADAGATSALSPRKVQTSDPKEIDATFLASELGLGSDASAAATPAGSGTNTPREEKATFARPKGPGRKR